MSDSAVNAEPGRTSGSEALLLTVITVHRNEWDSLSDTMRSLVPLRAALGAGLEWVVVDGASTVADPMRVRDEVESVCERFVSEVDAGIYDAMNKGTHLARGDYVLYLNAGDLIAEEGIASLVELLASQPGADVVLFDSSEGMIGGDYRTKRARRARAIWYGMPTHHQAMVFRRDVAGGLEYDCGYPIAADYDLVCRLYARGAVFRVVHATLCAFDMGGLSSKNYFKGLREQERIRREVLRLSWMTRKSIHVVRVAARALRRGAPGLYGQVRYTR